MKTKLAQCVLGIDQGTTGSRAVIFDAKGNVISSAYQEFKQYYPNPGWVEHNAEEIWRSCSRVIASVLETGKVRGTSLAAIGITNQRETTLVWQRKEGKPVARAIVWQCRRTAGDCDALKKERGSEGWIRKKTGLVLDPYFSATKIRWLLKHVQGLQRKAKQGELAFGTMDSWLIWKLTGGREHRMDLTNASRTLLLNILSRKWDPELLNFFDIPKNLLPQVQESGSFFGTTKEGVVPGLPGGIPIAAVMGDQQAALYGQGCHQAGQIKNTYGTGCFLVLNTGKHLVYSKEGLLSTICCDVHGKPLYALEGSIFIAGAVMQWLRDGLGFFAKASDSEQMIRRLKDNEGVYFVPAFTGLGAPYWKSDARGLITGLTRGSGKAHLVRAALESIAYQTRDVFDILQKAFGRRIRELKVDGGATKNRFLMQFQADILGCQILRPEAVESTVRGAAELAGKTVGLWTEKDLRERSCRQQVFRPKMPRGERTRLYTGWKQAVRRAL